MGIVKKSTQNIVGKWGNVVGYFLNGQYVVRTIGVVTTPPSQLQLSVRMATKVVSAFLDPVMDFIFVGFANEAKRTRMSAQNQAFSYNRKNAVVGSYPDVRIDFAKVLLTLGVIPMPLDIEVSVDAEGVACTWGTELRVDGAHWADQVMIVAYCEALSQAVYLMSGAKRYLGKEHMPIFNIPRGNVLEIYVSFISEDRKRIASSLYKGQLLW